MKHGFSIIIPTYRPNELLRRAVDSVIGQDQFANGGQVLVCVNGPDRDYYERLRGELTSPGVEVFYTPTRGPSAGRNLGLDHARNELLLFLDDDDTLEPGVLDAVSEAFDDPDVNLVVMRMDDITEAGARTDDTYYNHAMRKIGAKKTANYLEIAPLLATVCGKVYRSSFFQEALSRMDESLHDTEDVLFWADNFGELKGWVQLLDSHKTPAYLRYRKAESVSRPDPTREFAFYVDGRLAVMDRLAAVMANPGCSRAHKYFLRHLLLAQLAHMQRFYERQDAEVQARMREQVAHSDNPFVNQSLFSNRKAIAFCHNFPPYVDASAYVASKRLAEIDKFEGSALAWQVFAQNMGAIRSRDDDFKCLYVDFQVAGCDYAQGTVGFQPAAQMNYVVAALDWAKNLKAEVVYSRSLFPGSHIAAYEYKLRHPEVKWYAEFSDPLAYGVDNQPRACTRPPSYFDVERMVYEKADHVIFTNANQLEYMMAYNPLKDLEADIRRRSLVWRHPVVDRRLCHVLHVPYRLDPEKINIAYFGTFYPNRGGSQLLTLLENEAVSVHVFTTKPRDFDQLAESYQGRLRVNATVGHLQMLDLASRMDYLFVGDTDFPGDVNPFVPSKFADYRAAGSAIIATVGENTVLAGETGADLVKVREVTRDVAMSLKPQVPRDEHYVVDENGPLRILANEKPLLKQKPKDIISRTIQCYRDEGLLYTLKRILALGRH